MKSYKISNSYVVRFEFFGGLLQNVFSSEQYLLDFNNTLFLKSIQMGMSLEEAITFVRKKIDKHFEPEMEDFFEANVIEETEKINEINVVKLQNILLNEMEEAKKKYYLNAPLSVTIYLSSACQLSCKFCYYQELAKKYKNVVDVSKWISLIDQIKEWNVPYLSILGGEPTLYSQIDTILKHVEEIEMKTNITTNAVNIRESTFEILTKSKFIDTTVSLQSLNSKNRELTGIDSSVIIHNIKRFLEAGYVPRINTVMTKQNLQDIKQIIDFCEDIGIKEFSLNVDLKTSKIKKNETSYDEYRNISDIIQEYIYQKGYLLNFSLLGCMTYVAYPEEDNPIETDFDKITYGCEAGQVKLEVMPNGHVLPCTAFGYNDFKWLNAFEKNIKDIWNSAEYLKTLRNYKNQDSFCKSCKFHNFCNGGCPASNLKNYNSLEKRRDCRCTMKN